MPARSISAPRRLPGGGDPVFLATDSIGDAWSWLVLREAVLEGVTRFNVFQTRLGIARETLAGRLDHLTNRGLLGRDGPDYRLTPCGKDMFGCLVAANHWGDRWCGDESTTEPRMTHCGCGHPFRPVFRCSGCRERLDRARRRHRRGCANLGRFDRRATAPNAGSGSSGTGAALFDCANLASLRRPLDFADDPRVLHGHPAVRRLYGPARYRAQYPCPASQPAGRTGHAGSATLSTQTVTP